MVAANGPVPKLKVPKKVLQYIRVQRPAGESSLDDEKPATPPGRFLVELEATTGPKNLQAANVTIL